MLARKALGLTEDATEDVVIERITAERERRAELAGGEWRDYKENAADESWLFPGHEGLPPTKEAFNDLWHKVRDASGWSTYIPYKNMRHHAALWWYSKGFDWVTIADWDGHDVDTLRKYYVIRSEDATRNARSTLDSL